MKEKEDIIVLTGDLGFGLFDEIRESYPHRFINCGAAEQAMSDIAVGLALSGKTPVVYSITPFLLYRAFETWRTYVNHEILHVILLGSGRDNNYEVDGFSHDATDDDLLFTREVKNEFDLYTEATGILDNFQVVWPKDNDLAIRWLEEAIKSNQPWYINLTR